ncbi:MAG: N-acetylglucosamine-6-phosphate deacetylase [Promethearchaeota archaeon]
MGFVDLQVNGYKGVDFSDPKLTLESITFISKELCKFGVIGYCPTLISSTLETYKHNLRLISEAMNQKIGAQILGIHLEGPFINPEIGVRGIHPQENIISPSIDLFEKFQKWAQNQIILITIAPEVKDAFDLIENILDTSDIVVSIGHTNAGKQIIKKAIDTGIQAATHVGNGLQNMIHRHDNPLWPILADQRVYGLFITDGFHLPDDLIKVSLRSKGSSRFIVTSDLVHIAGLNPGLYNFHGDAVILEKNGLLHSQYSEYLAGSTKMMFECVNYLSFLGGLNEKGLHKVGYKNPLNLISKKIEKERIKQLPKIHYLDNKFVLQKEE